MHKLFTDLPFVQFIKVYLIMAWLNNRYLGASNISTIQALPAAVYYNTLVNIKTDTRNQVYIAYHMSDSIGSA